MPAGFTFSLFSDFGFIVNLFENLRKTRERDRDHFVDITYSILDYPKKARFFTFNFQDCFWIGRQHCTVSEKKYNKNPKAFVKLSYYECRIQKAEISKDGII